MDEAIKLIEKRRDDFISEHMRVDPSTGCLDGKDSDFEYIGTLDEIIEQLRRIT